MTKWTKEQEEAIHKEGMSILVSAGAGSGKTAVLTERVLRKVKDGISLNQLLILTFTKAAASEMKERIRKSLQESKLLEAVEQVDTAYITTFDSFALSMVKKYHYLLDLPQNVSIVDASIIELQKEKILNEIFEKMYESKNPNFEQFIIHFCTKDDNEIKSDILNMHNKLDLKYDKIHYLENYIEKEMQEAHFEKEIQQYMEIIQDQLKELSFHISSMEHMDYDYYNQLTDLFEPLLESKTYENIRKNAQITLPRVPSNNEPLKKKKETLTDVLNEVKRLTRWVTTTQIVESLKETQKDVQTLITILIELEKSLSEWKYQNNAFEFHDIAKLAIRVVKENPSIQSELKQTWNEILLDEYQDTSDLQEAFIELIANNNVYMVGDMKQSIYRFRNANPNLFKVKYDNYRYQKGGIKIDLIQNFRSRKEPLDDINAIFNCILHPEIGGIDYKKEHQMIFGNQMYEEQKTEQDMHMKIFTYAEKTDYNKEELEAFLVVNDIQEKVRNHFQVVDSKTKQLRDVKYQDFVILMDRSTQFNLYKQIFEYEKIPLAVHKEETITSGFELRLIYHILKCMQKMETHTFDIEWKYAFTSIMRSYLLEEKDDIIFMYLQNENYEESKLWPHIENLLAKKNHLNNELLLQEMIEEFDFYQAFIKVGNVQERTVKMEYLLKLAENLSNMGYDCYKMMDFLKEIAERKYEIRFSQDLETENSVSIMTIHKSKGLEFPICYYTGMFTKFNKADIKERITYEESIGFVIPTVTNGLQNTIRKDLLRYYYQKQEIAEKIRLFYVALTRSKEQIIMVIPSIEGKIQKCNRIQSYQALRFQSFYDIVKSIYGNLEKFSKEICLDNILSKDYKIHKHIKKQLVNIDDTLAVHPVEISKVILSEKTFSKKVKKPIDYRQYKNIELGKQLHSILEHLDFEHPNYSNIPPFFQEKIARFLSSPIFLPNIIHIYKEYEFYGRNRQEELHGIIDLMIEYEDEIKIVDYKLKQIMDDAYLDQLYGYQMYIESITDKKVNMYLYSIIDGTLEEIGNLVFSE